MRQLITYIQ